MSGHRTGVACWFGVARDAPLAGDGVSTDDEYFCGCCGNEIPQWHHNRLWCSPCSLHISPSQYKPLWERTYEAVTGEPCPYQVGVPR